MALIGKIRKNTWLLIILIGLALAAFIVMDMTSSQTSAFGGTSTTLGSIAGKKVDYNDFTTVENLKFSGAGGDRFSQKNFLWNYFVEEAMVSTEAEALGLGVSGKELKELQFGPDNRLSPIISQGMRSQTTGQIDRENLDAIKNAIETNTFTNLDYRSRWANQEKEIIKERLQTKLQNLVSKAVYVPSWMANQVQAEKNQKASFNFVRIPFDQVDDAQIELTDADYSSYLADNKAKYYQAEAVRKIDYLVFNVKPSKKDSSAIRKELRDLKSGTDNKDGINFVNTTNDSSFVKNRGFIFQTYYNASDIDPRDPQRTKKVLDPNAVDQLFQMNVGDVYGPYLEGNEYKLVKLLDSQVMADSAKCRHILIGATTPEQFAVADARIDSLKEILVSGAHSFDSLALNFSTDQGSKNNGGVYDFAPPTRYVPEFSDAIFWKGDIGGLYKVRTSYGVHLIEPLERKGERTPRLKVAYISKAIEPSKETQNQRYDAADEFLGKSNTLTELIENATAAGFEVETSPLIKENDFNLGVTLGSGDVSRDVIKAAFDAGTGEVFPKVYRFRNPGEYFDSRYVIAGLRSISPAGDANLEDVRADIEPLVRNMKKGEMLASQISNSNLSSLASKYQSKVDSVSNIAFTATSAPGLANEPSVIAAAFGQAANAVSTPIVGNNGVYIVQTVSKPAAGAVTVSPQQKNTLKVTDQNQLKNSLMQAWKKKVSIKDYRSDFF